MPMDVQRSGEISLRGRVRGCAMTPDGKYLVTGASDKLLRAVGSAHRGRAVAFCRLLARSMRARFCQAAYTW